MLISVRRLERLDKDEYLQEERTEAEEIYEQRRLKEEEDAAAALLGGTEEANNTSKANENQDNEDNEDWNVFVLLKLAIWYIIYKVK